ncbi:MAG: hypothetical protein HY925_05145 [Elusimicrobia bacterium]|nr:hypothetical protein [Elusimicrobiota bacterium]
MTAPLLLLAASLAFSQERSSLSVAAQFARNGGDCATLVPFEHLQSLPLPVMTPKGLRYRVMYYRAVGKQAQVPSVVAEFDGNGVDVTCRTSFEMPRTRSSPLGPFLTAEAAALDWETFEARQEKLYALIERAAALFAAGRTDKKIHDEFLMQFYQLSEPAFANFYQALAPGFWDWLSRP